MRSMIKTYAHEEKSKVVEHDDGTKSGGEPTGKFWMNQADALLAAKEVLATHKDQIATENGQVDFDATWKHFDVNADGLVEVERFPQFLRYLTNGALNVDLQ